MRRPFHHVYAFCRTADDLADESSSVDEAMAGINEFREQIRRIFEGGSLEGIFIALAHTVDQFNLPRAPFDDLLDAFVQDQSVHRYDNEMQLLEYCRRSANPVGRVVLAMADSDTATNLAWSDEICTGLQLANFWQDVARDFQMGRIYLPQSVMRQYGFDESEMRSIIESKAPTPTAIREAIAEQCAVARQKFVAGTPLIDRVPSWLAADLELFIHGGLATLDAIGNINYDVLRQRVKVGRWRQVWLVSKVLVKNKLSLRRGRDHSSRMAQTVGGDHV